MLEAILYTLAIGAFFWICGALAMREYLLTKFDLKRKWDDKKGKIQKRRLKNGNFGDIFY